MFLTEQRMDGWMDGQINIWMVSESGGRGRGRDRELLRNHGCYMKSE